MVNEIKTKLILLIPFLFSTLAFCSFASGSDSKVISYSGLNNSKFDTLIVAKVGEIEITAKEFLLSYEYGPAFVKRSKDSRKRYLDFMINEKLLALDGYSHNLDSTRIVTETLQEIEGDLATEELYKEDILSQVTVKDEEIAEGVEWEKIHLSIKWLYAPSFDEISGLQKQLSDEMSFDSLFTQQLSDSVFLEDRFMETTKFRLQTKNPTLAAVIDTLQFAVTSASIGTADGWYIIKITDLWKNAITTESEQNRLRYNVNRALVKLKADVLSSQYVQQMMLDHTPVIKRHTFDLLRAYIGKSIFPKEKYSDWNLTKKLMAEFGPIDSVKIDDHFDKTLVQLSDQNILLNDFLIWHRTRSTNIRFSSASPKSFFVSLEQFIWRMVRDKLLVKKAVEGNLNKRQIVTTQKQWWQDKSVYSIAKTNLAKNINLDHNAIHSFYQENKNNYSDKNNKPFPWEKVKVDVKKDAYNSEYNKKLFHYILALRKKYKIEVNDFGLNQLSIDIEEQPNAIDIYTAKKGGTFPRPAYPTIDYDWRAWH